jgi:hypothetical protein
MQAATFPTHLAAPGGVRLAKRHQDCLPKLLTHVVFSCQVQLASNTTPPGDVAAVLRGYFSFRGTSVEGHWRRLNLPRRSILHHLTVLAPPRRMMLPPQQSMHTLERPCLLLAYQLSKVSFAHMLCLQ